MQVLPKEIHRTPLSLKILWSTGEEEWIDYIWLRSMCSCAVCRERGPLTATGGVLKMMTEPRKFNLVGNYAIGIFWADQHHSIFSYESIFQHNRKTPLPPIHARGAEKGLA